MAHRPRKEMIAETRAKLVDAARQAFGSVGYADASMDDFTAAAGLTRGALYHHFGDKKGLLQAVIAEIDAEMSKRLRAISATAKGPGAASSTKTSPISRWRWSPRSGASSCATAPRCWATHRHGRARANASAR